MDNINVPPASTPELHDIQGLIIRGYTHPCSVHMMFKFSKESSGLSNIRGFFKELLPYLQNAEDWGALKPQMMLNISLTAGGIAIAKPSLDIQNTSFKQTFKKGPWDPSNAQQSLGDYGAGDPSKWWNKKFKNDDVHCIVHAYAMNPGAQDSIVGIITTAVGNSNGMVTELKPLNSDTGRLEQYPMLPSDYIHFEYRDSIDEPNLDDDPAGKDEQDLNNFLIGYSTLPNPVPGPTTGREAIFAKNGCYNAFRVLFQDTGAFYSFLKEKAVLIAPQLKETEEFAEEWLAAKMCGRWRNGSPLVLSPEKPEQSTSKATDFKYAANDDMQGLKCPFSAHTRVSNPRDEGVDAAGLTTVPRLIRRGMAYGPPSKLDPNADRGLIGLFLCGDLNSQFETIYEWINVNNFSAVFNPVYNTPQDPLVANRIVAGNMDPDFTIPMENGKDIVVKGPIPQFVVTRGTAYCLLPSISALRGIAEGI